MLDDAKTISNSLITFININKLEMNESEIETVKRASVLFELLSQKYKNTDKIPACFRDDMQAGFIFKDYMLHSYKDKTEELKKTIRFIDDINVKMMPELNDYGTDVQKVISTRKKENLTGLTRRG